jgi:serine/threonine-protein kinase HipA
MLRVWVGSKPVGVLDRSGKRGSTFVYDVKADGRDAVSLTMPKRTESWNSQFGLLPIFDMNLPEGALEEKIRTAFAKALGRFDDIDLLAVVGRSQIGRIRFTGMEEGLVEDVPFRSIDDLLRARREGDLYNELLETYAVHSGVAGVQPKVLVRVREDKQSDGRESLSVRGATHIVKMWDPVEYPELAANEFFCLMAAQEIGLDVPDFRLSEDGLALVVERFDLTDGLYLGSEDFCVLNGVTSKDKYNGGYETKLFRRIKEFVSPENAVGSLEAAFRLFVINCAIRNGDAHLKNFGVVYKDTESPVRLAPVYDLITTRAYIKNDAMALTLDGSTAWPDRKKLDRLGVTRANLRPGRVAEIVEQTCDTLSDVSRRAKAYFGESRFPQVGERMLREWQAGVSSLCEGRRSI